MEEELLFRAIRGRVTPAEEARVRAWRSETPAHEQAYRSLAEILAAAKGSEEPVETTPPAPLRLIHAARARPIDRAGSPNKARRLDRVRRWSPMAAAVVALVVAGATLWQGIASGVSGDDLSADEFVTGTTETATVTLRDGTVVRMAPNTRLRLMPGAQARRVALQGQAYFAVAKNPARPFTIETGSGRVEVLGTRFDLSAGADEVRVVVVEGTVALTGRGGRNEVRAGEMGRIVGGTALRPVAVPDAGNPALWVGTFLAFQETPLREAAREIEQLYGVRIEITDPSVAVQTITTWFADQPVDRVLEVFCLVAEAECTTDGAVTRVRSKRGV